MPRPFFIYLRARVDSHPPFGYIIKTNTHGEVAEMEGFHTGQVVYHGVFGAGRVVNVDDEQEQVAVNFIKGGVKFFTVDEAGEALSDTPFETGGKTGAVAEDIKEAVRQVLLEEGLVGTTPMGDRWDGGEMVLRPGRAGLQEKSVPLDTLFHKIVMIRNQLRLLEQNVNSSKSLTDSEKVDMQGYITRCYGSLTTFNVLFADKDDWFVGSKKE